LAPFPPCRYAIAIKSESTEGVWKQLQIMTTQPPQQPVSPVQSAAAAEASAQYLLQIHKTAISIVRNVNELFKR
jgi:hypothetical protein